MGQIDDMTFTPGRITHWLLEDYEKAVAKNAESAAAEWPPPQGARPTMTEKPPEPAGAPPASRPRRRRRLTVRRARPGAPPGTLVVHAEAQATRVRVLAYGADAILEDSLPPDADFAALRGRAPVTWIQVAGLADIALIERLGAQFGIHRLVLEDVVNVHQRPKVDTFVDQVFIAFRAVAAQGGEETEQISLIVGDGYVISFHETHEDCLEPLRDRIREGKGRVRQLGADYLSYAVIDTVIDAYFPVLEAMGETIDALEDAVIARPAPAQVHDIHDLKRRLMHLRRAIWPMRDMANALIRDDVPGMSRDTRLYLRDCYDHLVQLMDIVETDRETVSALLEVYLSSLSARMNEIMKVLTIIATIFIPLGFFAGLWGMNFDGEASPFNMPELGWRYGYPAALAFMAVIAGGLLYYFRRKGWIGGLGRPPRR
ncbi:MAG: magnesium and cobalt transport protein CorA [Rhodospirillales bacterium CG15_BIG_FIL_POST_REV_8_21_14_020_66_15]|nr:MAG: magnesium and cobalt transport protein CorA [Rhodospirillales bacterium CG15_BIG_FIL_POST_REV_8_21_14_020_66_15]